ISVNAYTFVQNAFRVLSEPLYIVCSLAAIIFLERYVARRSYKYLFLSIIAVTAACYSRQVGIMLIASAVAYLLYRKDLKAALILGIATVILIIPWWYRTVILILEKGMVPVVGHRTNLPPMSRLDRFFIAFLTHCFSWAHWVVFPTFFAFFHFVKGKAMTGLSILAVLKHMITILIVIPTVFGFIIHTKKKRYFFDFYIFFYGGAICLAGNYFAYRLLYPIAPFLFYYLFIGTDRIIDRVASLQKRAPRRHKGTGWPRALKIGLLGILVGSALLQNAHQVYSERTGRLTRPWNAYFLAAEWAKDDLPEESTIMCYKPNNFYLISGRRCVQAPDSFSDREGLNDRFNFFLREFKPDYIVITVPSFPWGDRYFESYFRKFLEKNRRRFKLIKMIEAYGAQARVYKSLIRRAGSDDR
ncbi:hypothetical protein ACFL42_05225, partial [Candidatus Omnitrophota bacterium]